nr:hypothetical protein [Serratia marcescens]
MLSVEYLSRLTFNSEYGHFSHELLFRFADSVTKIDILLEKISLLEQVSLIEKYNHWLRDNPVIVTLNVDDHSLRSLTNDHFAEINCVTRCIHFEISESSTRRVKDRVHGDPSLKSYSFWFDDFGSGYIGFSALHNSQFRFIKPD